MPAAPSVRRSIVLASPPRRVWETVSRPERLSRWLGGEVELDVRPGGEGVVRLPDGARRAVVEDVRPGRRLTFHWWDEDAEGDTPADAGATTVTIDLYPVDAGTQVIVTERPVEGGTQAITAAAHLVAA